MGAGGSAVVVLDALSRLAAGRTTLLVTHDRSLLEQVDRVVELVDGTFVERDRAVVLDTVEQYETEEVAS